MRGYQSWRYASSSTVLLRQWSESAGSAAYTGGALLVDCSSVAPLHCLRSTVAVPFKAGFCHSSTPGATTDSNNVRPEAGLSGRSIPGEGAVERDNVDRAGCSSSRLQKNYGGLHKVGGTAGVTQAPPHPASNKYSELDAGAVLSYLAEQGFTAAELAAIHRKYPGVAKLDVDARVKPVLEYFQGLGLNSGHVVKMVGNHPRVLSYSVSDKLQPIVDWLSQQGVDRSKIGRVLARHTLIFNFSIENNLQPVVDWLLLHGVDRSRIRSMLEYNPQIFTRSIENCLQPKLNHLFGLGLKCENIHKLMLQSEVMHLTIDTINAKCDVLRHKYGLPEDFIQSVLNTRPQILKYNLLANFNSYLDAGLARDEIRSMVMNNKGALTYNINNSTYKAKLQFYLGVAQYKIQDVADCPRLMLSSLKAIEWQWGAAVHQGNIPRPTPKRFVQMLVQPTKDRV